MPTPRPGGWHEQQTDHGHRVAARYCSARRVVSSPARQPVYRHGAIAGKHPCLGATVVGVDLFFAISGFVIARSLIPALQGCSTRQEYWQQTRNFWLRRAFRLLPSAWLWLALMLLACVFINRSGAFGTLQANLQATLAGVAQYANFRFADSFFHYEYGTSFVYWSLSLE